MASTVNANNRIVYVDPNDVNGYVGSNPLTPDYSDFCIYCNLIVEHTSRLKNGYAGENLQGNMAVSADFQNPGVQYTSFFQGESVSYPYLTTNYTDIHFTNIKKQTFVEGLQITGIDVNYANRMSPTVTIQMVDVRGSGLFGREEATHGPDGMINLERDEENNIIDNIYSGFMSFPYPRYRIQLKGFYGRAVTYQLMCSNFVGKLDSQTGNFNITLTFIGYEYGCLADLPLIYVMAAPFTKTGKEYWDKQISNPKSNWNLFMKQNNTNPDKDEKPILLYDFYKKIKSKIENTEAGQSINEEILDTSLENINKEYETKTGSILAIDEQFKTFEEKLKLGNPDCDIISIDDIDNPEDGDKILVIFSGKDRLEITQEIANIYNNIGNLLKQYTDNYKADSINCSLIPNHDSKDWEEEHKWQRCSMSMPLFLKRDESKRKLVVVSYPTNTEIQLSSQDGKYDLNDATIKMKYLNLPQGYTFNSIQSVKIYNKIMQQQAIYEGKKPYASVIVCKNFMKLSSTYVALDVKKSEYDKKVADGSLVDITKITGGISPYIGNYFKLIFCHVETFIHTMYKCVDDIYSEIDNGDREPSKLGVVNNYLTDVPKDIYSSGVNKGIIPPFPGIYKTWRDSTETITNDGNKHVGWVGDVKGSVPWREQQLVEEYNTALKLMNPTGDSVPWVDIDEKLLKFNLLPCFVDDETNKRLFYTRDGMAYYIAIMSTMIIAGMNKKNNKISTKEAELIGAILALNIYNDNENSVRSKIAQVVKGDKLSDDLYNISTIKNISGNDEAKRFEFALGYNEDRKHRILSENGNNLQYVYMLTSENQPIIPLNSLNKWSDLPYNYNFYNCNTFAGGNIPKTTFSPKIIIDGDYITLGDSGLFIKTVDKNFKENEFFNSQMCSIWLDACNVGTLQTLYDEYSDSGEDLGNYKKNDIVKHILKKYWLMEDNYINYQKVKVDDLKKTDFIYPAVNSESGDIVFEKKDLNKLLKLEY